jgi:hypothetical protein
MSHTHKGRELCLCGNLSYTSCIAVHAGGLDEGEYLSAEAIERQAETLSLWQPQDPAKCRGSAAVCAALRDSVVNSEPCHGIGLLQKNLLGRDRNHPFLALQRCWICSQSQQETVISTKKENGLVPLYGMSLSRLERHSEDHSSSRLFTTAFRVPTMRVRQDVLSHTHLCKPQD